MDKPTLQHRLEYALLRAMERGMGAISPTMAERLGGVVGRVAGSPLGIRRSVVEENLRRAFPGASEAWLRSTTRETYEHLGREAASMLRLSKLDAAGVQAVTEIPDADWHAFQAAMEEGRGVVLATGHFGNWEMAAAALAARGAPIVAIVKRQSNPLVDARIREARTALGIEAVDMGEAARKVPRALLSGKAVGIVADQDARHSGIWIPFFGVPASTHRGPALFALRLGSPLFAAAARRLVGGRYRVTCERVEVQRSESREADVRRITTHLGAHLEAEIRRDPAQYFWFHKRWKTTRPEEPLPAESGTTFHSAQGEDAS